MGLCKCRQVTNLFCYKHKKNVCEKCLCSDHQACIVRSYLQWLQDSDYDPLCQICKFSLDNGSQLVRLSCLDLFHKDCIDLSCNALPEYTAHAGYFCFSCQTPIIPPDNAMSQISNQIRQSFKSSKWAKPLLPAELFAPLSETVIQMHLPQPQTTQNHNNHHQFSLLPTPKSSSTPAMFNESSSRRSTITTPTITGQRGSSRLVDDDDKYAKLAKDKSLLLGHGANEWMCFRLCPTPRKVGGIIIIVFMLFLLAGKQFFK